MGDRRSGLMEQGDEHDVFGDEYEVDFSPADGFRPSDTASIRSYAPSIASSSTIQLTSPYVASDPMATIAPRNSIRKSHSQRNPFESTDDLYSDNSNTSLARSPSIQSQNFAPGIARRSDSSASSRQFAGGESSRFASGPSHPYTMYPQGTLVRTGSSATSTVPDRARGSLMSRTGPAHPYGMYTQGITQSDDDDEDETVQNPLPVGFGSSQTYRRVRGPEGEEQDIIGAYGHAEQLPPYTQFAEGGPIKASLLVVPEPTHTRSPVEGSDPGMPLMHEPMSRQQSMTDESQLEQSQPLLADTASSTEASTLGKKSWKDKTWTEKKETRIFRVKFSVWLLVLAGITAGFIVLVASLAGYLAGKHSKSSTSTTLNTSFYDVSLIPTPTNSMPSGSFALSLGTPEATQADCLTNPAQRAAWDCQLAGQPAAAISVGLPPYPAPTGAFLFHLAGDTNVTYGAQYQSLATDYANLVPVQDNDNSTLGPAFYFQQTYNKVVVVPESALSASSSKRWWRDMHKEDEPVEWNPDWQTHRQLAQPGDKPWFCIFNDTLLEGFIYVQRPAVTSTTKASSSLATSIPISSATVGSTTSNSYASATAATTTTTRFAEQAIPTSMLPRASSFGADHAQPTPLVARGDSASAIGASDFAKLQGFPYLLKLEERRVPNNPIQAYCQQYQILDNERTNWVTDSSGNPVKIMLSEQDPDYTAYQAAASSPAAVRRSTEAGSCHCQWMHGLT